MLVVPSLAAALVWVGCGKNEPSAPPEVEKAVESARPAAAPPQAPQATAPAESPKTVAKAVEEVAAKTLGAFDSADAETKSAFEKAMASMKAGNYAEAMKEFQALSSKANLTPEQKSTLSGLIEQVKKQMMSSATDKAVSDPQGALQDATKALPLGK